MIPKIILKILSCLILLLLLSGSSNSLSVLKQSDSKQSALEHQIEIAGTIIESDDIEISYPRSSIPVIVENGGNFTVEFKSDEYENIYFYISTAFEPIVDELWLDVLDTWKENNLCYAKVEVPTETIEELYNITLLTLKDDIFYSTSRPRAVSVVDEFTDDFTFIHMSDFHVGDPRGFAENIYETLKYRSIKKAIEEVNLLHPDFVIISGDLVFGQLFFPFEYSREYKKCYELLQMLDVPTYLAPGNHDGYNKLVEDGLELWEKYFGPLYYSFDYGNYHFQSINSYDWPPLYRTCIGPISLTWGGYIRDEQLNFIEQDLENNTDANKTFMFLHHNPLWDTKRDTLIGMGYNNREELLALIDDYDVDMVLAGHTHIDNVTIQDDTIFIVTTTIESEISDPEGRWGYRQIKIEDGNIVSYNYKEPESSIPSYKINIEYENDYTAKVINELEMNITVLLKFTVPKRAYLIQNGTVDLIRENNLHRQYYVLADIEKESEKEIKLSFIS